MNKALLNRVRQCLSDTMSLRKRNARDALLQGLGYSLLHNRRERELGSTDTLATQQMEELREKFGFTDPNGTPDYSAWRMKPLRSLRFSGSSVEERSSFVGDKMFGNSLSISVLQAFLGFTLQGDTDVPIDTTLLVVARLDAWIGTSVWCMEVAPRRGGPRIMEMKNKFRVILPVCLSQVSDMIYSVLLSSARDETSRIHSGWNVREENGHRLCTSMYQRSTDKRYVILATNGWFCEHITVRLGGVHDAFIAVSNTAGTNMVRAGSL